MISVWAEQAWICIFPYLKKIMIDDMAQLATVSSSDRSSKAHKIEYFYIKDLYLMLDL